jgi:hypothetical protein
MDQTGARVPGAHVAATNQATGARIEAATGADGQATLQMNGGTYQLRVHAKGIASCEENEIEVKTEIRKNVTLRLAYTGSPIIVSDAPGMLPDRPASATEIPLIATQQFSPPNRPLRRRSHWL